MFNLEDINTLKRAQSFLLMHAYNVEQESVMDSCYYKGNVAQFAEYLVRYNVITDSLRQKYVERFGQDKVWLDAYGGDPTDQLGLLLETEHLDPNDCSDVLDNYVAAFYAVAFLCDDNFRNQVWDTFVELTTEFDMDFSIKDLDEYQGIAGPIQFPIGE